MRAMTNVDFGTVPAWVGAVGSCLAFLLAVWIYGRAEADRRREQARLVTPLMLEAPRQLARGTATSFQNLRNDTATRWVAPTGGSHFDVEEDVLVWQLKIVNRSDEAITAVEGEVHDSQGRPIAPFRRFPTIAPTDEPTFTLVSRFDETQMNGYGFRIRFTDGAGRRWKRSRTTPLKRSSR